MEQNEYEQAVKKAVAFKPKENYLVIELYYDNKIILPYKDGITLMAALNNAEHLKETYNEPHRITGLNRDVIKQLLCPMRTTADTKLQRYSTSLLMN